MELLGAALVLLIIVAGLLFIVGASALAAKLLVFALALAILLPLGLAALYSLYTGIATLAPTTADLSPLGCVLVVALAAAGLWAYARVTVATAKIKRLEPQVYAGRNQPRHQLPKATVRTRADVVELERLPEAPRQLPVGKTASTDDDLDLFGEDES